MNTSKEEQAYRKWLGERIEGYAGTLEGEGRGLWSLNTKSLEKLYTAVLRLNPRAEWSKDVTRYMKL